jgi:outer membrane protein assembly factor BamB
VRSSPAVVEDGTIYFGSDDRYLYALNPDGTERWHFLTGGPVRSSLARDTEGKTYISPDGTVYFGSDDGNLYAVNIETPTEKWKFRTGGPIESIPLVKEDRNGTPIIYFGSFDGHLYAVGDEGDHGEKKWQYPKGNREPIGSIKSSSVMGRDDAIYFGSDDGNVYALEDDGGERWIFPTASFVTSSPAMGEGDVLFAGSWDGHLYAIDLKE